MSLYQAKPEWLLIVVFYILINNTLHCTFKRVTGSFNASLMATFNKTTEEECMSKCSMVLECTFMEYNEAILDVYGIHLQGTCKTFKFGTEVQELDPTSQAFSYLFDEEETSCPTATVSRPRSSTKKTTVKLSIDDICDRRYNYSEWEAVTKKSLTETPDDIRTCLFSPSSSELDGCTLTVCSQRISIADWMYTTEDANYLCRNEVPFACINYHAKSPYAVAQYLCNPEPRFVTVIDTEADPNSVFPEFARLERYNHTRIFYVQKINCAD